MNIHFSYADIVNIHEQTIGTNESVLVFLRNRSRTTGDTYIVHLSNQQYLTFTGGKLMEAKTVTDVLAE